MDDKVVEKLEKLVKEGKISPKEKEELERAMGFKENETELKLGLPKEIECHFFESIDLELSGDDAINEVIIDKGKDFLKLDLEGETLKINFPRSLREKIFHKFPHESLLAKIRVPYNFPSVGIKLVSGDLDIKNLSSKFKISVVSGDVSASGIKGDLMIDAMSGDISLRGFKGEADISTKSGDLDIRDSTFKGSLKTYSGDISIENSELSEIKATTFNGDIEIEKTTFKGNGDINTYFGDVSLNTNLADVFIKAETLLGDIVGGDRYKEISQTKEYAYEVCVKTKNGDILITDIAEGGENGR